MILTDLIIIRCIIIIIIMGAINKRAGAKCAVTYISFDCGISNLAWSIYSIFPYLHLFPNEAHVYSHCRGQEITYSVWHLQA